MIITCMKYFFLFKKADSAAQSKAKKFNSLKLWKRNFNLPKL